MMLLQTSPILAGSCEMMGECALGTHPCHPVPNTAITLARVSAKEEEEADQEEEESD